MDMTEDNEIGNHDGDNDKTVERSSFYKKLITRATSYLTLNTVRVFTQLRKTFTITLWLQDLWSCDLTYDLAHDLIRNPSTLSS